MKIIFVRHGENSLKKGTLTRTGVKQIKAAAKYLKNEDVDAIFCSPKTRTIQTANILKQYLNAEVYIEKNFNERQILTPSQRVLYGKEFDDNYLNYNFQSQNYETCKDFIDRNIQGFLNILSLANISYYNEGSKEEINSLLEQNDIEKFKRIILKENDENSSSTIVVAAHSSTLYALNAFINGIPKDGKIKWLQCNNGAVVKFYI